MLTRVDFDVYISQNFADYCVLCEFIKLFNFILGSTLNNDISPFTPGFANSMQQHNQ